MPTTTTVRSVDVTASPDEVWEVLGDFPGISRWAPGIDHSSALTSIDAGPGAARRIQLGRRTVVERVLVWEPPTELSYVIEGLPPVVRRVVNTWSVDATPAGVTVALTTLVEVGPRPPHRLVGRVVATMLGRASDQLLAGLAAELDHTRRALR